MLNTVRTWFQGKKTILTLWAAFFVPLMAYFGLYELPGGIDVSPKELVAIGLTALTGTFAKVGVKRDLAKLHEVADKVSALPPLFKPGKPADE